MQVYFETEYVTISYHSAAHAVMMVWKMPPLSSEFREALGALLAAMEHFKTGKTVADSRQFGTLAMEDQEWSATEWAVAAKEKGYSHMAIVMPEDVYAKMAIDDAAEQGNGIVVIAYFDTMEAALKWITQC